MTAQNRSASALHVATLSGERVFTNWDAELPLLRICGRSCGADTCGLESFHDGPCVSRYRLQQDTTREVPR